MEGDQRSKWSSDKKIREAAAKLHQTIEEQNHIRMQKARIYRSGLKNEKEFLKSIDEMTVLLEEELKTSKKTATVESQIQALKTTRKEFEWVAKHPEALNAIIYDSQSDFMMRRMRDQNLQLEGIPQNAQPPMARRLASESPQDRMRTQNTRPVDRKKMLIEKRIERLERELIFIRNQCDRIEEEINLLTEITAKRNKGINKTNTMKQKK
jgi:hypothetical protein